MTVNNFLAPFERIVDFRIIDRPFSVEKGELTPKGTYKRRVIEASFDNLIELMYIKTHTDIRVGGIEVRLPNWFLREKGCLSRDIESSGNELIISKLNARLIIELLDKTNRIIKIGSYIYKLSKDYLDLQSVLTNASLWIGNKELVDFTGESIIQWTRSYNTNHDLTFEGKIFKLDEDEYLIEKIKKYIVAKEDSLLGIHSAVLLLQSANLSAALLSLEYLKMIISDDDSPNYNLVQIYFRRPNLADLLDVKRELFKICIQNKQSDDLINIFNHYLNFDHDLINNEIIYSIIENINRDDFFLVLENLFESRLVLIE
ncbi:MAG: hypothetical protein KAQ90_05310, partial [Melioribacteraceae bacterium]|nr:hypothetical protein [Melioribacteraceae bacterium]